MKENIYNLNQVQLEEFFIKNGSKKFYAKELIKWLYEKKTTNFDSLTNFKKELRQTLIENYEISKLKIIKKEIDKDVSKYLFELKDNRMIEAVVMMHDYGKSVCISSQVGCNMGCKFCESGRVKKIRDLETYEMTSQVLQIEEDLGEKLTHVVIMGIGEPFDNYDNVLRFIEIINNPNGLKIGARHITISTSGIVPKIKEFMDFPYQVNLAISMHASNNKLRDSIMPINKVYNINLLINTLKEYIKKTNRRVTIEYILLKDINDQEENALELSKLLRGLNCYVNLIPYNETKNMQFKRSTPFQIMKFYDILKKEKINVTIRREFGSNITAACGQLRTKEENL